jgi:hypothetical protein
MMTSEALKQILIFALLGFVMGLLNHGLYWLFMAVVFAAYLGLTMLSEHAFRQAVKAGLLTRSARVRASFNVEPTCRSIWLVRRHILVTPGRQLEVPMSEPRN